MILKEIIENVKIEDIEKALKTFHYKKESFDIKKYIDLLNQLKAVPIEHLENNLTLHVEYVEDYGKEEHIWSASYSLYRRYKQKYSLFFITIDELSNALIIKEEVKNESEYIAHVLWGYLCNSYIDEDDKFQVRD